MTTPILAGPPVDRTRALASLVTAFSADPVVRWILPDTDRYLTHFPELLAVAADVAVSAGTIDSTEDYTGTALWLAPDVKLDDEALGLLVTRSVDAERIDSLFAFLQQMDEHHPTTSCWHLPFIGVDPRAQGRGQGSRLLELGIARCDEEGLPAYLEASSPRNRALYERHGFVVTGEIRVADSPPMWPMVRRPS